MSFGGVVTPVQQGFIPLPLVTFHLISAGAFAGLVATAGSPTLVRINGATDPNIRMRWAASNSVATAVQFLYPPDLDDGFPLSIVLRAKMAGAVDTPAITVGFFEGEGDTNAGNDTAALSAVLQTLTVTIAAADVGAYPQSAVVTLTPGAHTTDILYLYQAYILYTKRLS